MMMILRHLHIQPLHCLTLPPRASPFPRIDVCRSHSLQDLVHFFNVRLVLCSKGHMVKSRSISIVQPVRKLSFRRTDRYWVAWSDPRIKSCLHRLLSRFRNFDASETDEFKHPVIKLSRAIQIADRQRNVIHASATHDCFLLNYRAVVPPSDKSVSPVTKEALSKARNTIA